MTSDGLVGKKEGSHVFFPQRQHYNIFLNLFLRLSEISSGAKSSMCNQSGFFFFFLCDLLFSSLVKARPADM